MSWNVATPSQYWENTFFQESGEMMEQVTQVGCGICIPGDTQSLSGHSCDLIGTTPSRMLDEMTSRDHFQQRIILWFYHTLYEYSLTFFFFYLCSFCTFPFNSIVLHFWFLLLLIYFYKEDGLKAWTLQILKVFTSSPLLLQSLFQVHHPVFFFNF